jgi:hypothetical protein
MIVYMFQDRFSELVRDGSKRQTITHGCEFFGHIINARLETERRSEADER